MPWNPEEPWDPNVQGYNDPATPLDLQKLNKAIRDAESARSHEHASMREQIRINVLLEKLHREHSWQGIKRWEAQFYTKALHEAAEEARQSLFELAKEALQEAIYWAEKYPNNPAIQSKKNEAKKELANPNTTHEKIDKAKDALITEIRKEEKISLSEDIRKELQSLEEAILVAEKYPHSEGVKQALEEAIKVRDGVKDGEVSEKTKNEISEAKDKLIRELAYTLAPASPQDEAELLKKVTQATQLRSKAARSPIIAEILEKAIKNGIFVLEDEAAKEVKYNFTKAIQQLNEAIETVNNIPSLEVVERLEELMQEAKEVIDGHNLSFASQAKLHEALSEANYVKGDHLSTDEDYILAQHKLEAAIAGAEAARPETPASQIDKDRLKEAIEAAEEMLKREGLSREDGKILLEEIKKGEDVLKKHEAKKVEVQRTTEGIYAAIDNARPANKAPATSLQKEQLDRLLKEANVAKNRVGISYEDLRRLEYAISMGEQVRKNPDSKFHDYEEAIEVLKDTLEQTEPMNPIEDPGKLATAEDKYLLEEKMRELSSQKSYVIAEDRKKIDEILKDSRLVVNNKQATKQDVVSQMAYIDRQMNEFTRLADQETIKELRHLVDRAKAQIDRLDIIEAQGLKREYDISNTLLKGYDSEKVEISQKQAEERIYQLQVELTKTIKPASPEDMSKLEDLINQLNESKDLLTEKQQEQLEKDIEKAEAVIKDSLATDIDVDQAITDLNKWKELIKLQSDKNDLKEQVKKAEELIKGQENSNLESSDLKKAIAYANDVLNNKDANETTINDAALNLEKYIKEFEQKIQEKKEVDQKKELLKDEIQKAKAKLKENISSDSRSQINKQLNEAEAVLENNTVSTNEVQDAIERLQKVVQSAEYLMKDDTKAALDQKIKEAQKRLEIPGYIKEQQQSLENQVLEARKLLDNAEALEREAQSTKEKLEKEIAHFDSLATPAQYFALRNAIDNLKETTKELTLNPYDVERINKMKAEATQLLQTERESTRATQEDVIKMTGDVNRMSEDYRAMKEEVERKEKERLNLYIAYLKYMLGENTDFTVGNIKMEKFKWPSEEEENKKEAEELLNKAKNNEGISHTKVRELNSELKAYFAKLLPMTDQDKEQLKESIASAKVALESLLDNDDAFNKLKRSIENAEKYTDGGQWNQMHRILYVEILNELEKNTSQV